MNDKDRKALRELIFSICSIPSVSGYETLGNETLVSLLGNHFDRYATDAVGNCFFYKDCGKPNSPTVLIDAHFDEIGLIVTEVLDGGFLRIAPLGGIDPCIMQAADVVIYAKDPIRGTVVSTPPHLRKGDGKSLPDVTEMLVDTGYNIKAEELSEMIPVGTPIGFPENYGVLTVNGEYGEVIAGKSFDDKACGACAAFAIMNTEKEELAANVCLLFSAVEETNRLGGAPAAAFGVYPDYALVADVNLARVPDTKDAETVPFAKGISISVSAATDKRLTRMTKALCEDKEIPFCMCAAPSSTGTNAPTVNLVKGGIPVVDVGLPLKNMHTYNEIISMKDADALCTLVHEFICSEAIASAFTRKEWEI